MRKKFVTIFIIFIVLFSILGVSFARWQVVEASKWQQIALDARRYTQTIQTQRGVIKDRNDKILASNEIVYNIYVYKKEVKKLNEFVTKLGEIVGTPKESYFDPLTDDQIQYFSIAKKAPQSVRDAAVKLDCYMNTMVNLQISEDKSSKYCENSNFTSNHLTGITIEQTSKRIYPNGQLAAHLLGFVGLDDNGNEIGSNGVEGYYDKDLTGKSGIIEGLRDGSGNFILRDDLKTDSGQDGTYLQLTIDIGIQKIVEEKLKAQVESQKAKGGTVVVMDPTTGDILAMANYPTFDPAKYYDGEIIDCTQPRYHKYLTCASTWTPEKDQVLIDQWKDKTQAEKDVQLQTEKNIPGIFTNQGLSEVREPGSIIKVVTTSAAVNEGKVVASTLIPDHAGCIMITDRRVCTANYVGAKGQTVDKMLEISDNIGAYYVAKTIGPDTLHSYLEGFGIGKLVRPGLDGESIYELKDASDWTEIDLATAAFGQGVVSTNSLENISAIATVANQGKRMQPHILKRYVNGDKVKDFVPQVVATPITANTASQVEAMLERGTREGYTAPALKEVLQNYTMAGKTGTAQIPDGQGGYVVGAYNNTYIGFAPAKTPKYIMLVTMREPDGASMASFSAVPVWKDISKEMLPYMGILPDKK